MGRLTVRERVRRVLRRRGPLSMEAIAEALQLDIETVRPAVWEMRREGQVERSQTFTLVREPTRAPEIQAGWGL